MYLGYMMIAGISSLFGGFLQNKLKRTFKKNAQIPTSSGYSGAQIAQAMLQHYNVNDVKIVAGQGFLTDHYNPQTKTVSLSPDVYQGKNASAAAVAAHEVGHAIQHATGYPMLQFRSAMVPVVKVANMATQVLLMVALYSFSNNPTVMLVTCLAFAATTAFSLVTLPVEFDASKRALVYLDETGIAQGAEYDGAKDSLKWAAMTYVVAALSSLVMLVFFAMRYMSLTNNR